MPSLRLVTCGQGLSVLVTATGVLSALLVDRGLSFPALQCALSYTLLAPHLLARRRQPWAAPPWRYVVLALVDLEANYLLVLAYRYTSVTSVMLLDCFSIPCVMALSRVLLGARFSRMHFGGVTAAVAGLAVTVVADWRCEGAGRGEGGSRAVLGDLLCLLGAALYAVTNSMEEVMVKCHSREEWLGAVGLFGALAGGLQCVALEGRALLASSWAPTDVALLLVFAAALSLFYAMAASFLRRADATLFTLSLLTADVYSFAAAAVVFGQSFCALYCAGFAVTVAGVVAYSRAPPPTPAAADGAPAKGCLLPRLRSGAAGAHSAMLEAEPDGAHSPEGGVGVGNSSLCPAAVAPGQEAQSREGDGGPH